MEQIVTIEQLLKLYNKNVFECDDWVVKEEKTVCAIGNAYVPDHTLIHRLPKELRSQFNDCKDLKVGIHIIWLVFNTSTTYSGLVADKTDCKLYFVDIRVGDSDNTGYCIAHKATAEEIMERANKCNPYLAEAVTLSQTDPKALLEYQVYSNLSDRFYYMEVPFDDRVVMCGVGLHSNKLMAVGWLGKLINKDFFVSYAECTFETYEQLKQQTPSVYRRGQLMEKNKPYFSYFKTIFEKRKKHPDLVSIVLEGKKEPLRTRNVSCFYASPNGTSMAEYNGPAYYWMEEFLTKCKERLLTMENEA